MQVAGGELTRLSACCPGEETARNIHNALNNFAEDLRKGASFDYDDWAAVLYVLWYQPRRIHSVYQCLKAWPASIGGLSDITRSPFVVDFACGAGAMAFGTALALADVVLNLDPVPRKPLPTIDIWAIDSSPAMLSLGQNLWSHFTRMIDTDAYVNRLHALSSSCKAINIRWLLTDAPKINDHIRELPFHLKRPRYMSLLHGVYEDNQQMICEWMQSLGNVVQPDFVLTTSHVNTRVRTRTESAVEGVVKGPKYLRHAFGEMPPLLHGRLDRLTAYRSEIFERVHTTASGSPRVSTTMWRLRPFTFLPAS